MAVKTGSARPSIEYPRAVAACIQIRTGAVARAASYASGARTDEILALLDNARSHIAILERAISIGAPLNTYAQTEENDPTYDAIASFQAVVDALNAVIDRAVLDGNAAPSLINGLNPDGTVDWRSFSGTALAPLIATLNAVVATIDP